jgi:beta-lactamase superfamily II metal-dependent hydrolase
MISLRSLLRLGQLANVIGKGLGQNTVYVINPEKKPVLSIKKVEDVFCRSKNENRITYFLKKSGIFELESLVARAMTNTLITWPQVGKKTAELIVDRLIKEEYIFDVTDKSYQEKRYLQKNGISELDKVVPMKFTKEEEANIF